MTIAPEITDPAKVIADTLKSHGVHVVNGPTFAGPAVTQYAVSLRQGTKLRAVVALEKDIALALGLEDVRIVAPIPGTSYVGVEVPSQQREDVEYADFSADMQTPMRHNVMGALPIPIGVTVQNEPVWADLANLPHLLIAGTTMSGKSVALNSLITSLIDHRTPDEVRLWLVDPKRVELAAFADAPHVEDVATDTNDALDLLVDVEGIMDSRYVKFEEDGLRNIAEYRAAVGEVPENAAYLRMPYQVVVVDELADLMMAGVKGIEERIVRIAQLGRAAGIHLVLATQRPTKNVVTGLISANVTSRWSFAVGSVVDSMVALDQPGAQALYGRGDSLWLPAGARFPVRVQAVHADAATVERIVIDAALQAHRERVTFQSTRSPDAADDTDELEQLPGLEPLSEEAYPPAHLFVDGEESEFEQAVVTDEHAEPVLTSRPVDRSWNWLDDTIDQPVIIEPKLGQDIPADIVERQGALYAHTGEQFALARIAELERLVRAQQAVTNKSSLWRRHRAIRVAAYFVGAVIALGWIGNLVEAIGR